MENGVSCRNKKKCHPGQTGAQLCALPSMHWQEMKLGWKTESKENNSSTAPLPLCTCLTWQMEHPNPPQTGSASVFSCSTSSVFPAALLGFQQHQACTGALPS